MSNRDFSDSIKLEVIKANLEKYNGKICCEICGAQLSSIKDCHFDHIHPFVKGGKSTLENCQLLCVECNLKKNDKELRDFILEEKAKQFLQGGTLIDSEPTPIDIPHNCVNDEMTKELFDQTIAAFIKKKGNISNGLPTSKVIYRLFGSLANYQEAVGTLVFGKNEYISKIEIAKALDEYFNGKARIVETPNSFYESFNTISRSTIIKRYGNFAAFCEEHGIKVLVSKKTKYTKREVDDIISKWVKDGNDIPPCKDFSKLGLPSRDVILRYYEDWKEPFYIYKKLYEELGRH